MVYKNKIFLIGNGFDIAHNFPTKFSHFADYYIEKFIIPAIVECVDYVRGEHPLFRSHFLQLVVQRYSPINPSKPEDILRNFAVRKDIQGLKSYITQNYTILNSLLSNSLLAKLYSGRNKNWFDIENTYFSELIPIKDKALKFPKNNNFKDLHLLNKEFAEIKDAVFNYLETIEVRPNEQIEEFLNFHLRDVNSGYVINFNYTSSVRQYIRDSEKIIINHIHGSLKEGNIIFGYGNDQNTHYQEMKDLEVEDFLHFFKTFDYLQDINYDRIYDEALNKYDEYEVYIIGHSLGLTDKTLISEILNSDKCKKIYLFKRADLRDDQKIVRDDYRLLTYAASRILTDEKELRRKLVNFKKSSYFPN